MNFVSQYGLAIVLWGFLFVLGFLEVKFAHAHTSNTPKNLRARWPLNIIFGLINGALLPAIPVTVVWIAIWAESNNVGVLNQFELPLWIMIGASILIASLYQYVFHRLMHHIPMLWRVHRVHHCDVHLDSSTALRFHPLELIASIVFGVSIVAITGIDARTLVVIEIVEALFGVASHTSLKLPSLIEKYLRVFIITPSLHRLHHAEYEGHANKNFGLVLSFWDQVFGTYHNLPDTEIQRLAIGVKEVPPDKAESFDWLITSPWRG